MPAADLQAKPLGEVCRPGTPAYDQARKSWITSVDQHPALIVVALNTNDVSGAVCYAWANALSVAVQATGHGALHVSDTTLLIVISRMNSDYVNAGQRTAYVEAGAKWGVVLQKAQAVGLGSLAGQHHRCEFAAHAPDALTTAVVLMNYPSIYCGTVSSWPKLIQLHDFHHKGNYSAADF